ncbi:MAG TPA: sigma-70 family RNA polymerase sigma factor [Verrucomicrobiales bacterium]|jgi:RNA polymerase sigma-70 factor (ECF subfamily)|nr:sigma-70 family RNA polymerase sigma factor [Verrucomicrobiales bacterium]
MCPEVRVSNSPFPGLAFPGRGAYDDGPKKFVNIPSPSPSKDHVETVFSGSLTVVEAMPAAVSNGAGDVPDAELVLRSQNGSTEAFESLVTRYRGKIYAMTLNMTGSDADAWDLSQEVFIKAWRSLPKFEARSQFFTWIYRITHNVVIDWVRKRKIQGGTEFNDELGTVPAAGAVTTPRGTLEPDHALSNRELGVRIKAALAELSPEHRAVIILKEVDGLSYQEIADSVGCTIGTVMSRLFYARKRLQTLLQDVYDNRQQENLL